MSDMREAFEAWWFEEATVEELERARDVEAECWLSWQAAWAARKPREGFVEVPDDIVRYAKAMKADGYRGPLTWASAIIDWVAARPKGEAQ